MPHRLQQQTGPRIRQINRRPPVSPRQHHLPMIQPQPRLLLLRPVAFLAMLHQQRADAILKERQILLRRLGSGSYRPSAIAIRMATIADKVRSGALFRCTAIGP